MRPTKGISAARSAAKEAGRTRYFEATPCVRGHITDRFVANGGCTGCHRELRGKKYIGRRVDATRWNTLKIARLSALRVVTDLKKQINSLHSKAEACHTRLQTLIKTISEEQI